MLISIKVDIMQERQLPKHPFYNECHFERSPLAKTEGETDNSTKERLFNSDQDDTLSVNIYILIVIVRE